MEAPDRETPASVLLFLLALLPAIGFFIHWEGQDYDPGLLDFKGGAAGEAGLVQVFPDRLLTLSRLEAVRSYGPDNLYEYVNGHAEFYLGAGFKGLKVGEYAEGQGARQPLVVVDLFDMGEPLHAFGVLMDEAGASTRPLALGDMAFRGDRNILVIQGRFFLKMAAFADDAPLKEVAQEVLARLPKTKGAGLAFGFPDLGEEQGTRFIKENYRGLEFLGRVIEKRFLWQQTVLTAFLVTGKPDQIDHLRQAFFEFFAADGLEVTKHEIQLPGAEIHTIHDPYEGPWFLLLMEGRLYGIYHALDDALLGRIRTFLQPDVLP